MKLRLWPKPWCQLRGKFGHTMIKCYNCFDSFFAKLNNSSHNTTGDGSNPMEGKDQIRDMVVTPSFKNDMSNRAWFLDFRARNHVTNDFNNLNTGTKYQGNNKLYMGIRVIWTFFTLTNLLSFYPILPKHSFFEISYMFLI